MHNPLRQIRQLLRWKPFDTTTEIGRAQERHRRILWTTLASTFAKFTGVLTSIVTIPLTFNYLDAERFGLWMLFNTLVAFFNFADFGIGFGLINFIADAKGKNNQQVIETYIANAMIMLWSIAGAFMVLFLTAYPFIQWEQLFNLTSPQAIEESYSAAWVFGICIILSIPLNIVQKIQAALQRGFAANVWLSIASLSSFMGIISSIYWQLDLKWLIFSLLGLPLFVMLFNSAWFFYFSRNKIPLNFRLYDTQQVKHLLNKGSLFFVLYFFGSIAISLDSFLIAQRLGIAVVSEYAVPEKLFSLISLVVLLFISPLWAAYSEAFARGDQQWIVNTLKRSLFITLGISSALSLLLIVGGETFVWILMGKNMDVSLMLLIGFGLNKIVETIGMTLSIFLNGANAIHQQAIAAFFWAIGAIMLKLILMNYLGIIGVVWGALIAYSCCVLLPFVYFTGRILEQMQRNQIAHKK